MFRDAPVFIRGSRHVPPNAATVPGLVKQMFETYERDVAEKHAVDAGARLHYELVRIHPFVDGNGVRHVW